MYVFVCVCVCACMCVQKELTMPNKNTDCLYKLLPVIDGFNKRFAYPYQMVKKQSVDGSMILFKGLSTLKHLD